MPEPMPKCKERSCPRSNVIVLRESKDGTDISFVCKTCYSIQVRTLPKGWKRASYLKALRTGRTFRTSYDKERIYST
jgi:hypothetical protein